MAISIEIEGYDSLEQVAVGGMAAVYKARKTSIDKVVAIKVLFPYLASDQSFIERFQREAKSAAKIQHENIVNVVDFGESGGCYYIVMEFYDGVDIADLLKEQERIPLDIAAMIFLDVCLGLEAAHSADIVHRDIKPANIIYTNKGGIKIADFGLAKKSDTMTIVTQPGKVLGTPAYMSPEQAAGENVGPQSDIFSLGVVAFELFCGKRPFEGKSYSEVLERIQTLDPPSLKNENPLIQPDFEDVVGRMLEKDPAKRYANMGDVINDLERAMDNFEIKRDRRRLRKYMTDPKAYAAAFKEKMVSKCLSQGTFYMQKGKTHFTDAIQEFKRILYLDPSNERARKHLARLLAEHPDENSTVTIDAAASPQAAAAEKPEAAKTKKPSPMKPQRPRPPSTPQRGRSRLMMPMMIVIAAVVAAGGWWGWNNLRASTSTGASPMINSPSRLTVSEGETIEFSLSVVDADGDDVTVSSNNLPEGAELSAAGDFVWTVGYGDAGAYDIEFAANDGDNVVHSNTTIEVVDKDVALEFRRLREVTTEPGKKISVQLQAASAFGNPVEFALADEPRGMTLSGDRITWTPGKNQTGTYTVPVRGSDGIAEGEQTLIVRVRASAAAPRTAASGRVDWVLPKLANIYVDGKLMVREDTFLSIDLPAGKHRVRAELLDGMTAFEEVVNVKAGRKTTLEPPRLAYGRLSVYFLGGVGEFHISGKKFSQQPPFSSVVLPVGSYQAACRMFREEDSREFQLEVKEGQDTVVEYEIGGDPAISYE